ncbi:uncharacterized protein LOC107640385 [Arachis ipaensis]|uniref:uncharacterized protein LOC107640385 n=1 Tax=Arachis ipaensis TaxID=130454 RepID=UPI0007AF6EB4|nr:uncharacterized protein LOC107640385 [Arachis ipaensis]
MADFLVEVTGAPHETPSTRWKLHVDGASNQTFGRAGIIIESLTGIVYEQSVKFEFLVSNNQAEYEALIGGLLLSKEVRVIRVEVNSDSQVVTSQINGTYQAKDPLLQKYLEKVRGLSEDFKEVVVQHVPKERNTRADLLSKLASTKPGTGNRSLIQGLVNKTTVALCVAQADVVPSWMDPITDFLENGKLPDDHKVAKALRRKEAKYVIIQGQLFKRGLNQPLLKCLRPDQTDYVLREVHEGCCGHHIWGKALARKLVSGGYFWPSMMTDSQEFVKRCKKCQENANFHKTPASELSLLMASRPFNQWGIDQLGPFPVWNPRDHDIGQQDAIYGQEIQGVPIRSGHKIEALVSGAPQTNGQVEAANKVILRGLKRRLNQKKGAWADKLASVLWSYRTIPQSSIGETPFRLTYGVDAIIPVEVREPSPRLLLGGVEEAVEKDLVDETRKMAHLSEVALKQRIAFRYNARVLRRSFEPNNLVLRCNDVGLPTPGEGKLVANWEGPYRVKKVVGNGAYKLERLDGKEVSRTWNVTNLTRFYS